MAEQKNVDIDVDMGRVVDVLKQRFALKVAELEKENAMLLVALEDAIGARNEALEDNQRLREEASSPRTD